MKTATISVFKDDGEHGIGLTIGHQGWTVGTPHEEGEEVARIMALSLARALESVGARVTVSKTVRAGRYT